MLVDSLTRDSVSVGQETLQRPLEFTGKLVENYVQSPYIRMSKLGGIVMLSGNFTKKLEDVLASNELQN